MKTYQHNPVFKDFMEKLTLMVREGTLIQLRNFSRQRKGIDYYYRDLGLLLNYAVSSIK